MCSSDLDSIAKTLRWLKNDDRERERLGKAAYSVSHRKTGAARRDVDAILSLR